MVARFSRRNFLKTTGCIGGSVALVSGCRPTALTQALGRAGENRQPPESKKWVTSVCLQCPGGCGIQVKVVNGNAVKIEGNPLYPTNRGRLCPKGQAGLQVLYDPDRIKGPMRQTGKRGADRWVSISWDEALSLVAERLKTIRTEGRPHSLALMGGRYRGSMHELMVRFLKAFGSPNDLGHNAIFPDGSKLAHYFMQGWKEYAAYDWERVNYILLFGGSLLEAGRPSTYLLRIYGYLRGERPGYRTKIVCVDPRLSVTASKADEWIPINPGSDSILALAIAHVIIAEKRYDANFIDRHTFGFSTWQDENGIQYPGFKTMVLQEYTPQKAERITGISAETIVRIAREFSSRKPALAIGGRGVSLQTNGVFNQMAILALNALVGAIDAPGGILRQRTPPLFPWPEINLDEISQKGLAMPRVDGSGRQPFLFTANMYTQLPDNLNNGNPYPIDTLFLYYTNPLFSAPGNERFYRAFQQIPFIVSFSPFMDETTSQADLILPDHTYLERWQDDIIEPSVGFPVFGIRQPVVKPLYDTRNTADVIISIARHIGGMVAAAFPWQNFQEMLRYRVKGLFHAGKGSIVAENFDDFWQQLLKQGGWWDSHYEFGQWEEVLQTPSGKFEFFSMALRRRCEELEQENVLEGAGDGSIRFAGISKNLHLTTADNRLFFPHYEPPRIVGEEAEYPFHLNTYKTMTHAEGRGANQPWLQEIFSLQLKLQWEPWVEINPEKAAELGIQDEDSVWVESEQGRIKVKAKLFPGTRPNVVNMPFEYGHRRYGRWAQHRGMNPNRILASQYDYLGGFCSFYSTRVKIYKA